MHSDHLYLEGKKSFPEFLFCLYRLNTLVLGGDSGFVELYAYGMYKIATLTGVS